MIIPVCLTFKFPDAHNYIDKVCKSEIFFFCISTGTTNVFLFPYDTMGKPEIIHACLFSCIVALSVLCLNLSNHLQYKTGHGI